LLKRLVVFLILFTFQSIPQNTNLKFDQIGLEQGLSQATVYAITQDSHGFMWFGTQDGLNRYDGYSITVFRNNSSDINSLSDNTIWSLMCDKKGNLWIGTERGGLNLYNPSENKFYHYQHNEKDTSSLSGNYVNSIFEDSRGNIWIGTDKGLDLLEVHNDSASHNSKNSIYFKRLLYNAVQGNLNVKKICEDNNQNLWIATTQGLFRLNLNKFYNNPSTTDFVHYLNDPSNPKSISSNSLRSVYYARNGMLWIGTGKNGLNSLDVSSIDNSDKAVFTRYIRDINNPNSISGNYVTSVYKDPFNPETNLWIGTFDGGLNLFDGKNNIFIKYLDDTVFDIYEDDSGILWIGTLANGVKILDKRKNKFPHYLDYFSEPFSQKRKVVSAILEDKDGELWVSTIGNGLIRFNKSRKNIINYFTNESNPFIKSNWIYALAESKDRNIWIATLSDGLIKYDKKNNSFFKYRYESDNNNSIRSNEISTLFYDEEEDELWIGYSTGGISSYNISKNLFQHYLPDSTNLHAISPTEVIVIYKGKKSGLWIGTNKYGLNHFIPGKKNTSPGYFEHYQVSLSNPSIDTGRSINNNGIHSVYEDENGIVWIGTYGGGLNKYNPETGLFTYYTMLNGLPNDVVYGILPDNEGNLWLSTNKGLSKFNPDNETFRNYDAADGLQSDEFNSGAFFRSNSGELFFGGMNGFNAFYPDKITDNTNIPPVYITKFNIFDEPFPIKKHFLNNREITLSYLQNFFSFEFVALNYTSPQKNQYAYILEGFDKRWHYVSAQQRYASYTNLDPGEYVFRVKGSNNDGVWNDTGASVKLIIKPPVWMTWWFKILAVISFFALAFFLYNRRINAIKREQKLQQEISGLLIEKQEEERKRIAQEMHDSLGQDLLLIKNRILLTMEETGNNISLRENLNQISEDISGVLSSVRDISHNLRPPDLDRLGLTETLKSILTIIRKSTSIKITGEVDDINGLLSPELEINVVRIIQEAIGNVIKHAEATECRVLVVKKNQNLVLDIIDNGKGFDFNGILNRKEKSNGSLHKISNEGKAGLGLIGMTERVKILRGRFEVNSSSGKGTHIKIEIPINKRSS